MVCDPLRTCTNETSELFRFKSPFGLQEEWEYSNETISSYSSQNTNCSCSGSQGTERISENYKATGVIGNLNCPFTLSYFAGQVIVQDWESPLMMYHSLVFGTLYYISCDQSFENNYQYEAYKDPRFVATKILSPPRTIFEKQSIYIQKAEEAEEGNPSNLNPFTLEESPALLSLLEELQTSAGITDPFTSSDPIFNFLTPG